MTRSFHLNHTHFAVMLAVALTVHMVLGAVWALSPGLKVNKVPVHVLNIKLGSGALSDMVSLNEADAPNFARIATQPVPTPPPHENERRKNPSTIKKNPTAEKVPEAQAAKEESKAAALQKGDAARGETLALSSAHSALSTNANPSQYIRRNGDANGVGTGSSVGNSIDPQADIMQRYTQLISLWINRHRNILNNALQPGMKGNVVIRLRIDRTGKIHYFKLDKATGVPIVDAAAADMVRAANPVPPVPSNYPGGNMFEFLIPVGYTFQQ